MVHLVLKDVQQNFVEFTNCINVSVEKATFQAHIKKKKKKNKHLLKYISTMEMPHLQMILNYLPISNES